MFPPGYGQYQAKSRALGQPTNPLIAKFAARYKFAGQLNSIEILGASEAQTAAYLASLRLSLAFSAFETLFSALGVRGSFSLKSKALAVAFRRAGLAWLRAFLTDQPQTAAMRRRLENFAGSARKTDILAVVEATRHLMFHGVLNPSAAGITTKSAIAFIDGLCFRVFEEMDALSTQFFTVFVVCNNTKVKQCC